MTQTHTYPSSGTSVSAATLSKLRWRCRRGMRELDVVLQRYLDTHYGTASTVEQQAFEELLDLQDPQLLSFLMGREQPTDPDQIHVIAKLTHTVA